VTDGAAPAGTVIDDRLTIACGSGAIRALKVQREGKGVMDSETLLRGFAIPAGTVVG
jgi:methionyl-tRNA formyltransferase